MNLELHKTLRMIVGVLLAAPLLALVIALLMLPPVWPLIWFAVSPGCRQTRLHIHLEIWRFCWWLSQFLLPPHYSPETKRLQWAVKRRDSYHVEAALECGADIKVSLDFGNPLLVRAADIDSLAIVRLLLAAGAPVDEACPVLRYTPLMVAARSKYADIANVLLQHGASTSLTDAYGRNALIIAAQEHSSDVVRALLQCPPQETKEVALALRALRIATKNEDQEIIRLLNEAGICQPSHSRTPINRKKPQLEQESLQLL
jgi:hypothetical protein